MSIRIKQFQRFEESIHIRVSSFLPTLFVGSPIGDRKNGENKGVGEALEVGGKGSELVEAGWRRSLFGRSPVLLRIGAGLIFGGLIFGIWYYLHARAYESTDDATIEAYVTQVASRVATNVVRLHVTENQLVKAGDLLIDLDPRDFEARLSEARAALQVAEARERSAQATADHTSVAAQGDLEEASSVVNASKAALENARAQVTGASEREQRARSAVKAAEAAAQQAKAQIVAAEAEAVRASDDVKRYQRLYVQGVVSRQQWDQATAMSKMADARRAAELEQRSAAQAQVDMARAGVSNAVAERRQAESQLRQAQAQLRLARGRLTGASTGGPHQVKASQEQASSLSGSVEQARANVTAAELRLGYTKIFAPVSGRVTGKLVQVGNYVGEGQELMAIVRQDFYVTANYKETQLRFMRPGQQVYVSIDSFPGKVYRGHVDSIQCGSGSVFSLLPPENAAGNFVKVVQRFPVKIVFDEPLDPSLPIGPGMSVQPEVRVR